MTFFTLVGCFFGVLVGLGSIFMAYASLFGFRDSSPRSAEIIGSIILFVIGCGIVYLSVHYAPFTIGLQ